MSQEEAEKLTYIRNWEVATWHYSMKESPPGVDLYNTAARASWLANVTSYILNSLEGFAKVGIIDVTTDSKGEGSFRAISDTPENKMCLDSFLKATHDVSEITMWLSLKCIHINMNGLPEEVLLANNGWIFVDNNISEYGNPEEGLICIAFNLETNIYSPIANGDNRALAALNAPKLRKFLRLLSEIPSIKFDEIDDPVGFIKTARRYGVVDCYGYKMPDDPRAFEELLNSESSTYRRDKNN